MKTQDFIKKISVLSLVFLIFSCEEIINPTVYSEISPNFIENTESGLRTLLNSAYGNGQRLSGGVYRAIYFGTALNSGHAWNVGGSIESRFTQMENFTWTSTYPFNNALWASMYRAIRDANLVLANVENDEFSTEFKNSVTAEAKFLRGWCYMLLYQYFGPTPLFASPAADDPLKPRASEEEMKTFIEQQLTDAMAALPVDRAIFGPPTKGSAMGLLTKFYLNNKQWQKSADMAKQIIDMNKYRLLDNYDDVFALDNEGNDEILWAFTHTASNGGHDINALSFPVDYPTPSESQALYAAQLYWFDSFINSFNQGDTRLDQFVTEWTSINGEHVQGLGNDRTLALKYNFDPEQTGPNAGNDIPVVRYADILLSRAEALNELNGPTQEAVDLINEVRERAGVSSLNVGDFTKETLREQILQEREWEFFGECKSRVDMIRHGVFISGAQDRGINAQPYHVRFPIPQGEIDTNPNLEQNEGY